MKFTFGLDCNGDAIVFTALSTTFSLVLRQSHVTRLQKQILCFPCGAMHVYVCNLQCSSDPFVPPKMELFTCARVLGLHDAVCAFEWTPFESVGVGELAGISSTMCARVMLTCSCSCGIDYL
jgi:hypothetical protein